VSARVRALVVDDEAPARAALCSLLAADPEVEVVGACADGPRAVEALRSRPVDVVFLDIRMPGLDGFEVLRAAGEHAPRVVFVTAHGEHALEAFDVEAIDYLLKPFDDERFARALARAKEATRAGRNVSTGDTGGGSHFLERLTIPVRDGVQVVPASAIDWVEAQDYYVEVHVAGHGYLLRKPLKRLEEELDPRCFVRIHRSTIVNIARIQSLLPATHGERDLSLRDGTMLHVSRVYRERLEELLGARNAG
jgi:two-component system LytT family response regulator